jgi:hypothetical protein
LETKYVEAGRKRKEKIIGRQQWKRKEEKKRISCGHSQSLLNVDQPSFLLFLSFFFPFPKKTNYISRTWNCGNFLGATFVTCNLLLQLIPVGMILARKLPRVAIFALVGVVLMQSLAYSVLWNLPFFLR